MCEWRGCEVSVCVSGVVGYFAACVSYYDLIVEFSMQECILFVGTCILISIALILKCHTMQQMAVSEQTGSFFLTVF